MAVRGSAKKPNKQYTSLKQYAILAAEQVSEKWNPPTFGTFECLDAVHAVKGDNIPALMDRIRAVVGQCIIVWELTATKDEAINVVLAAGSLKDVIEK